MFLGFESPKDGENGSLASPPVLPLWLSMFIKDAADSRFFFSGVLECGLAGLILELLFVEFLADSFLFSPILLLKTSKTEVPKLTYRPSPIFSLLSIRGVSFSCLFC